MYNERVINTADAISLLNSREKTAQEMKLSTVVK